MNPTSITATQTTTLSTLVNTFENVPDDPILRGKTTADPSSKVLYRKTKSPGRFSSDGTRAEKRAQARFVIRDALVAEFTARKGALKGHGQVLLEAVMTDLRSFFYGTGDVRLSDAKSALGLVTQAETQFRKYDASHLANRGRPEYAAGAGNFRALMEPLLANRTVITVKDAIAYYVILDNDGRPDARNLGKMGALRAWITDQMCMARNGQDREQAREFEQVARSSNPVGVTVVPQMTALRRAGGEVSWPGHCSGLVGLMALAESRRAGGAEGVLTRLDQERRDMERLDRRGETPYSRHLVEVHSHRDLGFASDAVALPAGGLVHSGVGAWLDSHVVGGADQVHFFDVRAVGGGHDMGMGVTVRGGVKTFLFFDPNFGLARFSTADDLSKFVTDYHKDTGAGDRYGLGKTAGGEFRFVDVHRYDPGRLGALRLSGNVGIDTLSQPPVPAPAPVAVPPPPLVVE